MSNLNQLQDSKLFDGCQEFEPAITMWIITMISDVFRFVLHPKNIQP